MRILPALAVLAFAPGFVAFAQQRPTLVVHPAEAQRSDLSVEARLVVVPAVVRDKHGALVGNLTKDDFVLKVDDKLQTLRYFDHDADAPLTLGLLVDTSRSQASVLDDERKASASFIEKMIAPNRDHAFVVQFAHSVELLQDVTDSRPKLQQALKELEIDSQQRSSADDDPDLSEKQRRDRAAGGTTLNDAIFLSSDEILAKQKGRRALVLLTDGVDRNSKETLTAAIESAQRADTIVYAIYYKGEEPKRDEQRHGGPGGGGSRFPGGIGFPGGGGGGGWPGGGGQSGGQGGGGQRPNGGDGRPTPIDGKKILERICNETGGKVFEVTKKQTVEEIYGLIAEELRAQYRLGFTPSADAVSSGYHQIDLQLTPKMAKDKKPVQTRDGYYTGSK